MNGTPTKRAHVLIAAERLPTRVGLRLALEPEARCSEAADAESAVDAAVRDHPDVCLLGLDPSGQGLRVVNEIVTRVPSAAVILMTNKLDEEEFMAAMRAGASDDDLVAIWRQAVAVKLPGHGINDPGFLQPARPMSAIGG